MSPLHILHLHQTLKELNTMKQLPLRLLLLRQQQQCLNGVQQTKLNPSGVEITSVLEWLFPILVAKRKQAGTKGTLFMEGVLFLMYATPISLAMTWILPAKSMQSTEMPWIFMQWEQLISDGLNWWLVITCDWWCYWSQSNEWYYFWNKEEHIAVLKRLQMDHLQFDLKRKCKATKSIWALCDTSQTVFNKVVIGRSEMRQQEWLSEKLGKHWRPDKEQQTLYAALNLGNGN